MPYTAEDLDFVNKRALSVKDIAEFHVEPFESQHYKILQLSEKKDKN